LLEHRAGAVVDLNLDALLAALPVGDLPAAGALRVGDRDEPAGALALFLAHRLGAVGDLDRLLRGQAVAARRRIELGRPGQVGGTRGRREDQERE
jgi:hypothetical protein